MDSVKTRSVALFSIHPVYANALLDRTKLVEFRKTTLPPTLKTMVIYATHPTCAIVGYAEVGQVIESTPAAIWEIFGDVGGIGTESYFRYYLNANRAIAIEVKSVHRFPSHRPLSILGIERPPQSFQYLSAEQLKRLMNRRYTAA
ncbi:hypothetical protein SH501x_003212 [Pirellulaceae bacterium SH501]